MSTSEIREKLVHYIRKVDDNKVKALYRIIEDELDTEQEKWDESFIEELDRRSQSLANETAKIYSWKETKNAAIQKLNTLKK